MALFRHTWFFRDEESAGWTENYFENSSGNWAAAATNGGNFLQLRNAFLPAQMRIEAARATDMLQPRNAFYYITPATSSPGGFVTAPSDNTGIMPVRICLDLRMEATALHRRIGFIRGLPRNQVVGDDIALNGAWADKLNAFVAAFSSGPTTWGIVTRAFSTAVVRNPGTGVSSLGVLTAIAPITLTTQATRVTLYGISGIAPKANHTFRFAGNGVYPPGAFATFFIRGWGNRPAFPSQMYFSLWDLALTPFSQVRPDELSTRRTGRFSGLLRGKSSPAR